jgi:hypothetical protein
MVQTAENIQCVQCCNPMPALRFTKYGYRSCVNCSTVKRVASIPITNHKTGNSIQIVSAELAETVGRLAARTGYGVSKGIKG